MCVYVCPCVCEAEGVRDRWDEEEASERQKRDEAPPLHLWAVVCASVVEGLHCSSSGGGRCVHAVPGQRHTPRGPLPKRSRPAAK